MVSIKVRDCNKLKRLPRGLRGRVQQACDSKFVKVGRRYFESKEAAERPVRVIRACDRSSTSCTDSTCSSCSSASYSSEDSCGVLSSKQLGILAFAKFPCKYLNVFYRAMKKNLSNIALPALNKQVIEADNVLNFDVPAGEPPAQGVLVGFGSNGIRMHFQTKRTGQEDAVGEGVTYDLFIHRTDIKNFYTSGERTMYIAVDELMRMIRKQCRCDSDEEMVTFRVRKPLTGAVGPHSPNMDEFHIGVESKKSAPGCMRRVKTYYHAIGNPVKFTFVSEPNDTPYDDRNPDVSGSKMPKMTGAVVETAQLKKAIKDVNCLAGPHVACFMMRNGRKKMFVEAGPAAAPEAGEDGAIPKVARRFIKHRKLRTECAVCVAESESQVVGATYTDGLQTFAFDCELPKHVTVQMYASGDGVGARFLYKLFQNKDENKNVRFIVMNPYPLNDAYAVGVVTSLPAEYKKKCC